jgi:hypothetical protein
MNFNSREPCILFEYLIILFYKDNDVTARCARGCTLPTKSSQVYLKIFINVMTSEYKKDTLFIYGNIPIIGFIRFLLIKIYRCPRFGKYCDIYTECPNIIKTLKLCFFKWKLPSLILFLNSMLNYESNLYRSFLLICHRF